MSFTQADLDNLNAAIVGGTLEVEYQGRRVRFRSVDELLKAYDHVKSVMASQTATGRSRATGYQFQFTTSRGD